MAYQVKDDKGRLLAVKRFANDENGKRIEQISNVLATDDVGFEAKDFKDKDRSFLVTISRGTTDRVGDVVEVDGWNLKNYRKNPVVMAFHNYGRLPVGRSLEEFIKKDRLMGRPQFAPYPEAQLMYDLYRDGYLKGISCGFISLKSEPISQEPEKKFFGTPTRHKKQELLEYSVAPIPAHQDCLAEIKTYVAKGELYIPARYLRETEEVRSFVCNEYVHVVETDKTKFSNLYIVPIIHDDKGEDTGWIVYGTHVGESDVLYFNHKFIFKDCDEQKAVKWVEKNSAEVDVNKDEETGIVTLIAFGKEMEIEQVPYGEWRDRFEAKDVVLIETMPTCQGFECEDEIELPPSRREEAEASVIEQLASRIKVFKEEPDKGDDLTVDDVVVRPYPGEHSCRLHDPGKYTRFRRNNCAQKHDGKCIDVIYGRKRDGKSEIQALRYKTSVWDAGAARSHCKGRDGAFEAAAKGEKEKAEESIIEDMIPSVVKEDRIDAVLKEISSIKNALSQLQLDMKLFLNSNESLLVKDVEQGLEHAIMLDGKKVEEQTLIMLDEEKAEEQILILDEDEMDVDELSDEEVKEAIISTIKSELGRLD